MARMSPWLSAQGSSLVLFQLGNSPALDAHFHCKFKFIFLFYPWLSLQIDSDIHKIPENNYPAACGRSGQALFRDYVFQQGKQSWHTALLFFHCKQDFFFFLNVFPPSPLKQRTEFLTHSENTLGFSCGADFLIFELTKRQIDCNFLGTKNFFYCPPFVKCPAQLYLVKYHCLVNPRFLL